MALVLTILYGLSLQWFTLDEVSKGKLHLKLEWLTLKSTVENLDQVCLCTLFFAFEGAVIKNMSLYVWLSTFI